MAYQQSSLFLLTSGGIDGGGNIWRYYSPDPHATVEGAGYFVNGGALGMKAGDIVIVVEQSTGLTQVCSVTNVVAPQDYNPLLPGSVAPGAATISQANDEVGTWAPSVGGTATYTSQVGFYSVNGKCVTFWGRLTINAIGTGSASQISGLPFTSNATPNLYGAGVVPFFASSASAVVSLGLTVAPGTSQITLRSLTAAGSGTANNNILQNGTDLIFTGSYPLP